MSENTQQEFSKLRSFLWPVHNYELKKLLPMFLMFFCISFNYTILRDTKDTLIVGSSGAEAIPFLKVWGVVPAAVIFMLIYSKLSNILSKERLFYVTIAPFLIFFALFAIVLYPARDALHPTTAAEAMQAYLPVGLAGLVACFKNWTFALFYVLAELWGSVVLSLMFWGFNNEIMRVTEAKRFYSLFALGANIALLFSGQAIVYFSDIRKTLPPNVDAWQISLNYLMTSVVIAGVVIVATYWWMNRFVLTDKRFYDPENMERKGKKSKPKMSVMESFAYLAKSKYILCIAIVVISYGVCINLVEVTWKSQLKLQYPDYNDYSTFMGWFSTMTGAVTIVMVFIGGAILRSRGWGFAAMTTPVVLLLTGIGFFAFVIFRDQLGGFIAAFSMTPLMMAVAFGTIQNIMSKSTKYTLFDPTKEMSYIPLDQEQKVKGKAAIDVVGARLGKSGGSLIQQGLLLLFGTISAITPFVAVAMIAMIVAWMYAVRSLNTQFIELTGETSEAEKAPSTEPVTAKA
ncbi:MAG: NTP/NDP exchange transporter [Chlamydiales bacterium]|nr:NTP/NDP exchange transporter [Chlamydiales bacterium]